MTTTATVAVLTFRRNRQLARALSLLLPQVHQASGAGCDVDLLVIDNDAAGGARPVVDGAADPLLRYVVEPEPGIAVARNRALRECAERDLLLFIDDDEWPEDGWLATMLRTQQHYGAAAVAGPVRSVFSGGVDPWIDAGAFFGRSHRLKLATGDEIPEAATNNLLLDLRAVRAHELRFPDVGMAAGEDNLFTGRLTALGLRMVWCAEAWVAEEVPSDRATRRWVLTRSFSSANTAAHTRLQQTTPAARLPARCRIALGGLARCAGGAALWSLGALSRNIRMNARGARATVRGIGFLLGACGYRYHAYRRAGTS